MTAVLVIGEEGGRGRREGEEGGGGKRREQGGGRREGEGEEGVGRMRKERLSVVIQRPTRHRKRTIQRIILTGKARH